ncbi:MAG TPA: hypothetical protein VEU50_46330, partial [Archangium sp.]|nr:hypothetical protein [Archangium sp.]
MLTKVVLTRFRGFESLEAELRPISVILGPNSSGKTSLLHAVRVAVEAISIGLEQGHPELTKDGWITVYVAAQAGDGGGAGGARLGTVRLSSTPYPRQAASRNTASILPIRRDVQVLLTCLPQLLGPARRL